MVLADGGGEGSESLGPTPLRAFELMAHAAERFLADLVAADSGVEGGRGVDDQTPLTQSPQVFTHRRPGHSERTSQFTSTVGT
jgi:hypothetical protein